MFHQAVAVAVVSSKLKLQFCHHLRFQVAVLRKLSTTVFTTSVKYVNSRYLVAILL